MADGCELVLCTLGTALTAAIISSPAGAGGGAIFGAISYLVGRPVQQIIEKNSPDSKTLGWVAGFIAGTAAAWAISSALGVALTFKGAIFLTIATSCLGVVAFAIVTVAVPVILAKNS